MTLSSNRHHALASCLSMMSSENRYPLFGIMLLAVDIERIGAARVVHFLAVEGRIEDAGQREIACRPQLVAIMGIEGVERPRSDDIGARAFAVGEDLDLALAGH